MMTPQCPDHGSQLRDLLLGRLDEIGAQQAAELPKQCAHCAAWWSQATAAEELLIVDDAVADVFATVELPRERRRLNPLWAVAAAAMLAVGVSVLWQPTSHAPRDVARSSGSQAEQAISIMDFEQGFEVVNNQQPDESIASFDFEQGTPMKQIPRT